MKPDTHQEWQPLFALGFDYPEKLLSKLQPKLVCDCGSNSGGYIDTWKRLGAKIVHAFEPVPDMAKALRERYAGDDSVILHEVAVSDTPSRLENVNVYNTWSLAPNGSRADITVDYKGKPSFSVDVMSLDSLGLFPDFVKIDVDGYDYRVLKGMQKILDAKRPPIYFEFSHLPKFILNDDPSEMCDFIYRNAYKAVSMDGWICPDAKTMMTMYPDGSSYDIMLSPSELCH